MWQQKIAEIYQQQYAAESVPDWLKETVWQKVELHKKSKLCRVLYQGPSSFTPEQLQMVKQLFGVMLPKDFDIELRWENADEVTKQATTAAENGAGNAAVLDGALAALYAKKPKVKLWLLSCQYSWPEVDKLCIAFPSQAAKDTCEKLGVDEFLAEYLSAKLGKGYSVALQFEQELQHSIMAAAEKREEKIIASALTAQKVSRGYSGPIYGKYIYDSAIPIAAVFAREDFCVVRGEIIAATESQLKSGKSVYLLTIYDDTGYLPLKISVGKDKEFLPEYLLPGQWIKCRGKYGMDRFSGEVLFSAFDVEGISHPVWGSDLADERRVELALHSKEESFNSLIPVEQAVYTAAKWGQHGIGVANRHSAAAFPALYAACEMYDIKAVYGIELVVFAEKGQIGLITLWAKDSWGLAMLYRLLSLALSHGAGEPDGIDAAILRHILQEQEDDMHLYCALDWQDFSLESWSAYWRDIVSYLLVYPVDTKELQQQQREILQEAMPLGVRALATDGATCFSDQQGEIVGFLQENGGQHTRRAIRKLTSTDSLIKAFYYLGEERAKEIVVATPEGVFHQVASFPPIGGAALVYPEHSDFWQTILAAVKEKYDGVMPREILTQLEDERDMLLARGYYWLYPFLLQIKEKYGSLFIQDQLLTSYVLGLSRENPLPHFVYCHDCGFSGVAEGYLCPNCGQRVQEFGMGTAPVADADWQPSQKITLCGIAENKDSLWQDLERLLDDCLLIAPGVYRQLSWASVEAMAEIFLSGKDREELPGERQWLAATCQGMLLGVIPEEDGRFLVPNQDLIYQLTPVLEREGVRFTYFSEDVLSPFVLSLHYQADEQQRLFWAIYSLLPPHRQVACMQARNWAEPAVWTMLEKHFWQGIPYLEQLADSDREISSVDDFVRAVADCIGMSLQEERSEDIDLMQNGEELLSDQEGTDKKEETLSQESSLQSTEGLLCQFGVEIGLAWDICWLKAHAPEVFYLVTLNNLADRSNFRDMWLEKTGLSGKLGQVIAEMKAQGMVVLPVDINLSEQHQFSLTEKGILASLDSTSAFDNDLIEHIDLHRRQEKFSSQKDFFQRLNISPHLQHLFLTERLLDGLPEESQTSLF